jgi:hypothetical protein
MIKTFIINRDLLTYPRNMVEWVKKIPELEPIILDNDSTYPPLLEWYETNPCRIIKLGFNYGHTALWTTGLFCKEVGDDPYYIVTDPDLDMSTCPLDVVDKLKEGLHRFNQPKCGLAIRIDDLPVEYPLRDQVLIWESPFWTQPLGDDFYQAPIDTTFALHDSKRCRSHIVGGIRTGGDYTIRHLPFYLTPETLDDEMVYYFDNSNKRISSQANFLSEWIKKVRGN